MFPTIRWLKMVTTKMWERFLNINSLVKSKIFHYDLVILKTSIIRTHINDIALIFTETVEADDIKPVCLPRKGVQKFIFFCFIYL